ncbi:transcriptional regulator, XRE family [Ancylobacter novellus DSM 506]|uniref:Transcriptional regulator, XRE family n=2 Tax=Ancylobacter novellus TaxID=921 RepID=D7A1V4_ANCN5|nr:XRE family transcriptional regulator [Ancylobacter novellus]ADH87570.1 transcriptional regulator, XRE family [Ancylobacter novellus DSM 506]PZQ80753.1 MAG: XRE family transcriptional regulator [Ancylobacter novellus]
MQAEPVEIEDSVADQLRILAAELRRHRKDRQLSLEALSLLSGVSRSMISKIERGETVPSTGTLSRLAEALGTTFSQLMAHPVESEIIVIPADRQPILSDTASGYHRRCISPVLPGRGVDWVINTLPALGTSGEFVAHRRGVEEYIYVLKGRLEARVGARRVTLETGDALYFQAHETHQFTNLEAGECEYFLIINSSGLRG